MEEKTAAEAARSSLATLQENFEKHFGLDIKEQWAEEDNNRLQLTPTANERWEHKRNIEREVNREKEDLLEEADFKAFFTGSRSRRECKGCRRDGSLGPKGDAEKRMRERLDGKRKKSHVSLNYEGMQRNWQALVNEAESWEEGKNKLVCTGKKIWGTQTIRSHFSCWKWRTNNPGCLGRRWIRHKSFRRWERTADRRTPLLPLQVKEQIRDSLPKPDSVLKTARKKERNVWQSHSQQANWHCSTRF